MKLPDGYVMYYLTDANGRIPNGWRDIGETTSVYHAEIDFTIVTPVELPNGQRIVMIRKALKER